MRTMAQGDLLVYELDYPDGYNRRYTKVKAGKRMKIHAGEGRNHYHALEGDCKVAPINSGNRAVKAWEVVVGPGGANLVHMHANGKLTGEHDTITIPQGTVRIHTQRETSDNATAYRVID